MQKVFIVAEIGCNHNGDPKLAKMVEEAKMWCRCSKISNF